MKENSMSSIIAVSGGILGGVSKPLAGVIADVTITGAIEVAIYAALSAFVGLLIKEAYNKIKFKVKPEAQNQKLKAKSQKPKAE